MTAPTIDAPDVKVLNRADLTRRLVAKLKCDEAVVGGIASLLGIVLGGGALFLIAET